MTLYARVGRSAPGAQTPKVSSVRRNTRSNSSGDREGRPLHETVRLPIIDYDNHADFPSTAPLHLSASRRAPRTTAIGAPAHPPIRPLNSRVISNLEKY